jgi:hypothetical protein
MMDGRGRIRPRGIDKAACPEKSRDGEQQRWKTAEAASQEKNATNAKPQQKVTTFSDSWALFQPFAYRFNVSDRYNSSVRLGRGLNCEKQITPIQWFKVAVDEGYAAAQDFKVGVDQSQATLGLLHRFSPLLVTVFTFWDSQQLPLRCKAVSAVGLTARNGISRGRS